MSLNHIMRNLRQLIGLPTATPAPTPLPAPPPPPPPMPFPVPPPRPPSPGPGKPPLNQQHNAHYLDYVRHTVSREPQRARVVHTHDAAACTRTYPAGDGFDSAGFAINTANGILLGAALHASGSAASPDYPTTPDPSPAPSCAPPDPSPSPSFDSSPSSFDTGGNF